MPIKSAKLTTLIAALALSLFACGGDDDPEQMNDADMGTISPDASNQNNDDGDTGLANNQNNTNNATNNATNNGTNNATNNGGDDPVAADPCRLDYTVSGEVEFSGTAEAWISGEVSTDENGELDLEAQSIQFVTDKDEEWEITTSFRKGGYDSLGLSPRIEPDTTYPMFISFDVDPPEGLQATVNFRESTFEGQQWRPLSVEGLGAEVNIYEVLYERDDSDDRKDVYPSTIRGTFEIPSGGEWRYQDSETNEVMQGVDMSITGSFHACPKD